MAEVAARVSKAAVPVVVRELGCGIGLDHDVDRYLARAVDRKGRTHADMPGIETWPQTGEAGSKGQGSRCGPVHRRSAQPRGIGL